MPFVVSFGCPPHRRHPNALMWALENGHIQFLALISTAAEFPCATDGFVVIKEERRDDL